MRRTLLSTPLFLFLVLLVPVTSSAQVTKYLHFDVDGVLPSADPDISWRRFTPPSLESLFSVAGGYLSANTLPSTNYVVGYVYPDLGNGVTPVNGGLSYGSPFVVEARVRVTDMQALNVNSRFAIVTVWNGNWRFLMYFTQSGIRFDKNLGYVEVPVDLTQFHTIRMEGAGSRFDAYVDGNLVGSYLPTGVEGGNGFAFYNHDYYCGAIVDWDYIEFAAGENPIPVSNDSWGGVKAAYRE